MREARSLGIREVAIAAGVSPATASKVLSGNGLAHRVSIATIERVELAARELGYVPNAAARQLRTRHTGQIGLVWHDDHGIVKQFERMTKAVPLSDLYSARGEFDNRSTRGNFDGAILTGLTFAAHELGLSGVVIYPRPDPQAGAPSFLRDGRVDGLILQEQQLKSVRYLETHGISPLPIVALWTRNVPDGVGFADTDHAGGSELAVQHLIDLGHRKIGFLETRHGNPQHLELRHIGYRNALQHNGLGYQTERIMPDVNAVLEHLRHPEPITAVLASTDLGAAALTTALLGAGVRIPQDVSLVGYDDMPGADFIAGGLTTVYQAVREMSLESVRNLVKLISGEDASECRTIVPNHLVLRRTTAPPIAN